MGRNKDKEKKRHASASESKNSFVLVGPTHARSCSCAEESYYNFYKSERGVLGSTGGRQTVALTDSHCVLWVRIDLV